MPANFGGLLFPILLLVFFYIFLFLPEQKRQKKAKALMQSLKVGDNIMTRGGIYGRIVQINEDVVTIASGPDEVKFNMSRYSIANVVNAAQEEKAEYKEIAAYDNKQEKSE